MFRKLLGAAALAAIALAATPAKADKVTLNVGTLAPPDSKWGHYFKVWSTAVDNETHGAVGLNWYWNGSQGDEVKMVKLMRDKRLDGAAITANGLGQIYPHIIALQLIDSWEKLDAARARLQPRLNEAFAKEHFVIVGSGDVGIAHIMSVGEPIKVPADLASKKTSYIAGDPIGKVNLEAVHARTQTVEVPQIFPQLSSNQIEVINAPALAAEQLQWGSILNAINTMNTGVSIGSLIFYDGEGSTYHNLPQDAKDAVMRTGQNTGKLLTSKIRQMDNEAFERFKGRMKVYTPDAAALAEWAKHKETVKRNLRGTAINAEFFDAAMQ
jgi:TRAP-type C4-dicarboxylate transport system substrate-binding protein